MIDFIKNAREEEFREQKIKSLLIYYLSKIFYKLLLALFKIKICEYKKLHKKKYIYIYMYIFQVYVVTYIFMNRKILLQMRRVARIAALLYSIYTCDSK